MLLLLGLGGRRQWGGQRDLRDFFPGFASGFHGDLLVRILQFPESYGLGNRLVDVRVHARELVLVILELFPLIGERDWAERGCAGLDDLSHIIDNLFGDWSGGRELRDLRRPIREGDGTRRVYRRLHFRFRLSLLLRFLLCVFCHHLLHVRHLDAHFLSRFVCLSESCLGFLVRVLRVRKTHEHEGEEKQKGQEVRFHGADVSTAENAGANRMHQTVEAGCLLAKAFGVSAAGIPLGVLPGLVAVATAAGFLQSAIVLILSLLRRVPMFTYVNA